MFKNVQLAKEVRPLLWPWVGAVAAGALIAIKPWADAFGLGTLLTGIIGYGFLGGLALVATLSFGHELQDRTLPLLLTQPLSRSWMWNQKMLIICGAVFAAALVESGLVLGASGWYSGDELRETLRITFRSEEIFIAGIFLLATVCSCGFWTLFAGSIIGGLVFTVSAQFISAVVVALAWGRFRGYDEPFQDGLTFVVIGVAGLVYAGVFLWLGWRKFTQLEVRTVHGGAGGNAGGAGCWSRLLASRPRGPVLNLIKKELHLQKTVAQLAGVLVLSWTAVALLQWLRPGQYIGYLFDGMAGFYAPVTSLLAGCISLGEEKALGLRLPQRALPFAPWLHWLVRLGVGLAIVTILGLGLPLILLLVTSWLGAIHESGLSNSNSEGFLLLSCISGVMFVLGYWAIGLVANTLRAALVGVVGIIILPALTILGVYLGGQALGTAGAGPRDGEMALVLQTTGICTVIVMVGQSLVRARAAEETRGKLFLYSFVLGAIVLAFSFVTTCFA
jgi:hypothetical protein